jgi:hypothetical protein
MNFFPDPGSGPHFFLTISSESLLCYLDVTGLLLKQLTHETVSSKKKAIFLLLALFLLRT